MLIDWGPLEVLNAPAQVYFSQFRKTPFGMLRLDPQDAGPGYRNVVGIPGGMASPLFRVLQVGSTFSILVYANADLPGALEVKLYHEVWHISMDRILDMPLNHS